METHDWFLSRVYGSYRIDGYGCGVYGVDGNAREYNLGRNSMYEVQILHGDGYLAVIDGYEQHDGPPNYDDGYKEGSVTDATGYYVEAGTNHIITTHTFRHQLSIKRPDTNDGVNMEVRIIKKEPGVGRKDSNNSA